MLHKSLDEKSHTSSNHKAFQLQSLSEQISQREEELLELIKEMQKPQNLHKQRFFQERINATSAAILGLKAYTSTGGEILPNAEKERMEAPDSCNDESPTPPPPVIPIEEYPPTVQNYYNYYYRHISFPYILRIDVETLHRRFPPLALLTDTERAAAANSQGFTVLNSGKGG
ncbi:hypothetical protein G7Y89_g9386 [Cudoniella acicularis]|uniref:Uncharacterized protein n=1 Tax=Cudoniella acicularis TaxID=354080 RepID=A0A8H4W2N0_9HELO|nr:hypothetical protein G7Y89_g9386 [Cudoniella acicularis]